MISVQNISYRFADNGVNALHDISLEIACGEYICLIGANGSGKTTLLKHFNGLLTPTNGTVLVEGENTCDSASLFTIRCKVGIVFQNPDAQIFGATVEEDVAFGPENLCLPSPEIRKRVDAALAGIGISHLAKRETHTLSGGEKRLVAIAGVLAMQPSCIVLDEPTAYLDARSANLVLSTIKALNNNGMTIVHVTHNLEDIVIADRVVVMHAGKICMCGKPTHILREKELLEKVGISLHKITALIIMLSENGLNIMDGGISNDEVREELLRILKSKG